jgi:MFS family permease
MSLGAASPRVPPLAALGHRDFRFLYVGLLIVTVGAQITRVTTAWQIYDMTGSALALGLSGLFSALPLIPVSLLGGVLADAVERRRLLLITNGLGLLTAAFLAVLTATGLIEVWHLYVSGFLLTTFGVFDRPARQALIPGLVPRDHLFNAYTLMTTLQQTGNLIGPVIAGLALAVYGTAAAYAVHAISYVAVLAVLVGLRVPPITRSGSSVNLASVVEGMRFVWTKQFIVGLLGLDLTAMLFGYYQALLPILARDVLMVGEVGFGLLTAAPAAGAFVGTGLMLLLGSLRRAGWLMLATVAGYGLALVGLGASTWFPLSLGFAGLLGVPNAISVTIRHTAVQLATPDELRGRVSGVFQISTQGGNSLGTLSAGFAATALGAGLTMLVGGSLVVLTVFIFGVAVRSVREFQTA